ncbi:MAG: hypothetical protein QOE60_1798 [Thermoleophilaceae bacterium]|jgi:DNA-binding IclR family transcriptional regulator|nr:hypothetical protein [Thermoleophilaceae bacterium]
MSQTLDRALSILDVLAERPRRINDVAEHLGVHHSTALRLLHTLRSHGFVKELPDHSYRLGAAIFRLAFTALEGLDLRSMARPYMEELHATTGETIHLGTLEDDDVVYIEKVEARHRVRMHSSIGAIAALHCTAVSKAIVAYLPEAEQERLIGSHALTRFTEHTLCTVEDLKADLALTRERGYATNEEEHEPGIRGIGAPIVGGDGGVVGAISVVAPLSRIPGSLEAFATPLLKATQGTSRELGWGGR